MLSAPARPTKLLDDMFCAMQNQIQVVNALMMHDIKSRFFGNGLGYIVTIIWPATHIAIIVASYTIAGRIPPYGQSSILYACVSTMPYIIWNYISRFTMLGIQSNKSFLSYPVVKPMDIIISRQILEMVTSTILIAGVMTFLLMVGQDPMPHRLSDAAFGLGSAALLGVGFGVLGSVLVMIFPLFGTIYVGILILFWFTAGVVVNPEEMPAAIGRLFAWNPLLHCLEALRLAYYDDFPAHLLDRAYVIYVGAGSLTIGLILERMLRFLTTR